MPPNKVLNEFFGNKKIEPIPDEDKSLTWEYVWAKGNESIGEVGGTPGMFIVIYAGYIIDKDKALLESKIVIAPNPPFSVDENAGIADEKSA